MWPVVDIYCLIVAKMYWFDVLLSPALMSKPFVEAFLIGPQIVDSPPLNEGGHALGFLRFVLGILSHYFPS